jgi:hypothetical protein
VVLVDVRRCLGWMMNCSVHGFRPTRAQTQGKETKAYADTTVKEPSFNRPSMNDIARDLETYVTQSSPLR